MTSLNVALLGAGGQLGQTLIADWTANEQLAGDTLYPFTRDQLDICSPGQLDKELGSRQVHVIVNAAAYTQVDKAETDSEQAMRVNGQGATAVADFAARQGCRLIHLSTDFVFDGQSSSAYRPDHPTAPLGSYGLSKLAGEQGVRKACPTSSVIIRTSWLYSRYQPNFLTTMLRLMEQRDRLGIVADQIGTPTSTHSLAKMIARAISDEKASGIFHWSDAGVASWYDFAVAIQEEALTAGLLKKAIPIEPIKAIEYPTPAARPAFSVLDKAESYRCFDMPAIHWRKELRRVIEGLKSA